MSTQWLFAGLAVVSLSALLLAAVSSRWGGVDIRCLNTERDGGQALIWGLLGLASLGVLVLAAALLRL